MKKVFPVILLAAVTLFPLFAGGRTEGSGSGTDGPAPGTEAAPGLEPLTVGMMPAVNSLPLIIAEHLEYFREEGVEVELTLFKSQFYRETALQTGQIDGTISDLVNAVNERQAGFRGMVTSATEGLFALVAAPDAQVRSVEEWKSYPGTVRTGLLENSIVFYVAERMLRARGADPGKIELISTLHIPSRLEMVLAGELEAACLPEPVTRVAIDQGAVQIADTTVLEETPGVLLFSREALERKGESVRAFYRAYDRAAEELNKNGEEYLDVIIEKGDFPPQVRDTMVIPRYGRAHVTSRELYCDVAAWMVRKGLITAAPEYHELITGEYLP